MKPNQSRNKRAYWAVMTYDREISGEGSRVIYAEKPKRSPHRREGPLLGVSAGIAEDGSRSERLGVASR